ncbi:MAG: hydrogenase maturation protease [Alphaproteobacteria bacterium]|nr:hydrogenase maturation protease [Alphaproteobacteria bacterium]MDE2013974.1 hydrogenase maturation protease [Alphaproteobacteria bacterium]MDE2074284.1 hydrogenase maturation protease [Alphaproteobacteria bacterium]MDE2352179.1 hydrogenase maturation protease [Alphaproteobacteria bacterium]
MLADVSAAQTLVLGLGNILLTDDGVGVHVVRALGALQQEQVIDPAIALCDGGTIGLALLSEVETSGALIAIDATEMHAPPGAVRSFVGAEMDAQLAGQKRTAHEVALADLMMAANLAGKAPLKRALIGIQPQSTGWGLEPTAAVAAAIPVACKAALSLLERWNHER